MFGKSIQSSMAEPSFFYLMMAATCFRRAARTRHSTAAGALRDIGRAYLTKEARGLPTRGRTDTVDRRVRLEISHESESM